MQASDLKIFNEMPFPFWVMDEEGRYLWGNRTICDLAQEDVTGRTDAELIWAENAEGLRKADEEVWATGQPSFVHEYVDKSGRGKATLNVCKFIAEFEGKRCVLGVSFIIG